MILERDGEGFKGKLFCKRLGCAVEIEAEGVGEDYVRRCAETVEQMTDAMFGELSEAAKRYCLAFLRTEKDAQGDEFAAAEKYHRVTKDTPAEDVLRMCQFDMLYIDETEDESRLCFRLGGSCDWEIEHGLEADFLDGQLFYLGAFEQVDADSEYYRTGLGKQWNYALTFAQITADILARLAEIDGLESSGGISEEEIDKAEQTLQLLFPPEYRAILLKYGSIGFFAHEWTGLGFDGEGNVINMTQRERELRVGLAEKVFVLENAGIDGIIIAANEFGEVFQVQHDSCKQIHDSILEYLERCLR